MTESVSRARGQVANLVVRLLVGLVFLPEGMKKFLFPEQWGAGRFTRIGIPAPEAMAYFVGSVEIVCGVLLLLGFLTRLATLPLLADILVAILTTKVPLPWHATAVSSKFGFWPMQAESRTDFAMLMGLLFLAWVGAGPVSVDGLRGGARRSGSGSGMPSLGR